MEWGGVIKIIRISLKLRKLRHFCKFFVFEPLYGATWGKNVQKITKFEIKADMQF